MARILVTGANGFIGNHLLQSADAKDHVLRAALRRHYSLASSIEQVIIGDIHGRTDWDQALDGVDIVIHLAARVHVMDETAQDPLAEFRKVNRDGTVRLAELAAQSGVKRFVYASSIKVNGEGKSDGSSYRITDVPQPQDPYGISKYEAELELEIISEQTGMEIAVVRPPLVYGANVGGNFIRIVNLVKRGVPLPFGAVSNARAMISVNNLVSALYYHALEPIEPFTASLVRDSVSPSTAALIRKIAEAMNRRTTLLPVPVSFLRLGLSAIGKRDIANRLFDSLDVEIGSTSENFSWRPNPAFEQADLQAAVGQ